MTTKHTRAENGIGFLIAIGITSGILALSGCTGEIYMGTRRIDTYESKQRQIDKPLKCVFFSCPEQGGVK